MQEAGRDQVLVKAGLLEQLPDLDHVREERGTVRGASLVAVSLRCKGMSASQQRRSSDPARGRDHR
jgi:hypothetical protein